MCSVASICVEGIYQLCEVYASVHGHIVDTSKSMGYI